MKSSGIGLSGAVVTALSVLSITIGSQVDLWHYTGLFLGGANIGIFIGSNS